ncbi:MAG TPA: TonB-dependent receptor [Terriglobia bacterium]|nr:TonB-dependent receptor [Terriglobia bacterium]
MKRFIGLVCILALTGAAADAQTSRGTVTGIVFDTTRAVIAGASVELTNAGTGLSRTTVTNGEGLYRFDAVELGTYSVRFAATGFAAATRAGVAVSANQTAQIDAELNPSGAETVVQVTEAVVLLQTEAPVRGGNIESIQATELPFPGRNPVTLALTLPGVTTIRFSPGATGSFSVNGSRGRSNNFLIDGTENNDISVAGQGFQITNPDAVHEVSVQTSNFDSEFGRAGGAVVNVITKSGTNNLHGTVSYLLDATRDDAITNTQALSDDIRQRGHPLPGTDQWFAGTLGGPVVKDKTFFFGAYQERRQNSQTTSNVTTLSAAGKAALRSIFPAGRNSNVDTYLTVTNGADATSLFFPIALGSGRPDLQFGTAILPFPQTFTDRQFLGRLDHNLGNNDQLSTRYLFDNQIEPFGGATLGFLGFTTSQANRYQNFLVTETHILSPTSTNEARLAYNRIKLSFPIDPPNRLGLTLPRFAISGITSFGIQTNLPQGRVANNYVFQDTMTKIRGKHSLRFGLDLLKQRSRQFAPITERGEFSYQAGGSFSSFANFVDDFGGSNGFAARDFGSAAYYPTLFRQAYFVQDRWRAGEAFTFTLGLRYEYFGRPINSVRTPAFTGLFNIDPVNFTGPYSQPNEVAADKNNFSPAIGIAYSPTSREGLLGRILGGKTTVIRAGYHLGYDSFFNNIASNAQTSSPNLVSTLTTSTISTAQPRGFPDLFSLLPQTPRPLNPLDAQTLVTPDLVNPYYQRWSLGLQRELGSNWVVDISYVGSKGTRLYVNEDLNPLVPAAMRITPPANPPIPASRLSGRLDNLQGARTIRTNGGSSIYHAGQLEVTRRFNMGLSITGAYTYSRLIDNNSEVFADGGGVSSSSTSVVPSIFGGERLERAVSLFDRTHRAAFTYLYELPFLRDQRGVLGRIAGGFGVSGRTSVESGVPFSILNGQDANGIAGNNDRPDHNLQGRKDVRAVPSSSSPTGYINPDADNAPIDPSTAEFIGIPANAGRNGTLGRHTHRTPKLNNWDLNIFKLVKVNESVAFQFRTEFYNVFNHPQPTIASVSPFSPGSQRIANNVFTSPAGRFLNTSIPEAGGRVVRYQLKLIF